MCVGAESALTTVSHWEIDLTFQKSVLWPIDFMIRKICEFSLSLNDVHRPDWASTTMPADLVDVMIAKDGHLRSASSSSVSQ